MFACHSPFIGKKGQSALDILREKEILRDLEGEEDRESQRKTEREKMEKEVEIIYKL